MRRLYLRLRTPSGLLLDQEVTSIVAEDLDGHFGIRAGRLDLVAVLPAGLISYKDEEGEGFIAHSGGLLDLQGEECRAMVRDAFVTRDLADTASLLGRAFERRAERIRSQHEVLDDLEREALRRVAEEVRP